MEARFSLGVSLILVCLSVLSCNAGKQGASKTDVPPPESPATDIGPQPEQGEFGAETTALIDKIGAELAANGMEPADVDTVKSDMSAAGNGAALLAPSLNEVLANMTKAAIKALKKVSAALSSEQKKKFSGAIAKSSSDYVSGLSESTEGLLESLKLVAEALGSGVADISTPEELGAMLLDVSSASTSAFVKGADKKGLTVDKEVFKASVNGFTKGILDGGIQIKDIAVFAGKISEGAIKSAFETGKVDAANGGSLSALTESLLVQIITTVQTKATSSGKSSEAAAVVDSVKSNVITGLTTAATGAGVDAAKIQTAVTSVETSSAVNQAVSSVKTPTTSPATPKAIDLQLTNSDAEILTRLTQIQFSLVTANIGSQTDPSDETKSPDAASENSGSYFYVAASGDQSMNFHRTNNAKKVSGSALGATEVSIWIANAASCDKPATVTKVIAASGSVNGSIPLPSTDGQHFVCFEAKGADGGVSPVKYVKVKLDRQGPTAGELTSIPATVYANNFQVTVSGADVAGFQFVYFNNAEPSQNCASAVWSDEGQFYSIAGKLQYNAGGNYDYSNKLPVNHRELLCVRTVDGAGNIGSVVSSSWEKRLKADYNPIVQQTSRTVYEAPIVSAFSNVGKVRMIKRASTLHAVYHDNNSNELRYTSSVDSGGTWSAPSMVTDSAWGDFAIDVSGSDIVIVKGIYEGVVAYKSSNAGANWSTINIMDPADIQFVSDRSGMTAHFFDGKFIAVWTEEKDSTMKLQTAASTDLANFSIETINLSSTNYIRDPLLAANGSNAALILYNYENNKSELLTRTSAAANWGTAIDISMVLSDLYKDSWDAYNQAQNPDKPQPIDSPSVRVDTAQVFATDLYLTANGREYYKATLSTDLSLKASWAMTNIELATNDNEERYSYNSIKSLVNYNNEIKIITHDYSHDQTPSALSILSKNNDGKWTKSLIGNDVDYTQLVSAGQSIMLLFEQEHVSATWRMFKSADFGGTWNGTENTYPIVGKQIASRSGTKQIAKLNNVLIAAGDGLSRSTDDGASWSYADIGRLTGISVFDGKFVIAGRNGWIATSLDGINWSSSYVAGTPEDQQDECAKNGNYRNLGVEVVGSVALVGFEDSGCNQNYNDPRDIFVLRSENSGQTWQKLTVATLQPDNQIQDGIVNLQLVAGSSSFYRISRSYDSITPQYLLKVDTSTNGLTWSPAGSLADGDFNTAIARDSSVYILSGDNLITYSSGSFGSPVQVMSGLSGQCELAFSGNEIAVFFYDDALKKVSSTGSISSFGAPTTLDAYDAASYSLSSGFAGGTSYFFWQSRYGFGSKMMIVQ